jgi:hypothetical protein
VYSEVRASWWTFLGITAVSYTCDQSAQNGHPFNTLASPALTCSSSGFSLWGVGSSLVDSVTQNAKDFVSTIVDTDWQKELSSLQEELKHDMHGEDSAQQHSARVPEGEAHTSHRAQDSPGFSLASFGKSLATGTAEIFEQVRIA